MTLPIRWAVVRELSTDSPAIQAMLLHEGKLYQAHMVMSKNWNPTLVKIAIMAMTAEFENTVGGAP